MRSRFGLTIPIQVLVLVLSNGLCIRGFRFGEGSCLVLKAYLYKYSGRCNLGEVANVRRRRAETSITGDVARLFTTGPVAARRIPRVRGEMVLQHGDIIMEGGLEREEQGNRRHIFLERWAQRPVHDLVIAQARIPDDLRLVVHRDEVVEELVVQVVPRSHLKPPLILHLLAQPEVQVGDKQAIPRAAQARRAARIRPRDVRAAVKVTEVVVSFLAVAGGERVRKNLRADAIDAADVVVIRNRSVAAFNGPHGLGERANSGAGVEDDLGAVQPERLPV